MFKHDGVYAAQNGWNRAGLVAFAAGVVPNLPGFLHAAGAIESVPAVFDGVYAYAWFVGFGVAGAAYYLLTRGRAQS